MNVLLVCRKEDRSTYEAVIHAAPNTNLLGCVSNIKDNFVTDIKEKYHPHIIVWVSGTKIKNENTKEIDVIEQIRQNYNYIRLIFFTGEQKYYDVNYHLNDLGVYDIVDRNITNLEFNYLLENPLTDKIAENNFNRKKIYKFAKSKAKPKFNKMLIFPVIAILIIVAMITVLLVIKSNDYSGDEKGVEETIEAITESPTTATLFVESITQIVTEKPTEKPTQKSTEKPVQRATTAPEPTSPPTTQPPVSSVVVNEQNNNNVNNGVNNNDNNGYEGTVIINNSPPPASIVTDDGAIHFEQSNYTIKNGDSIDIYVSGLAASEGCNWNLTNNAVVKFSAADTTKATLRATGVGVTTVTATAKSNGATAQALVTVIA